MCDDKEVISLKKLQLKAVSIQRPPFCMPFILSLIFPKKFPPGYVIELNNREKDELIKNFDRH